MDLGCHAAGEFVRISLYPVRCADVVLQSLDDSIFHASGTKDARHLLRRLLLKLVLKCDKLPHTLFLNNVQLSSTDNFGGLGGFSDVFVGIYGGQRVAIKRLRVFQNMEPSKREGVKKVHSFSGLLSSPQFLSVY